MAAALITRPSRLTTATVTAIGFMPDIEDAASSAHHRHHDVFKGSQDGDSSRQPLLAGRQNHPERSAVPGAATHATSRLLALMAVVAAAGAYMLMSGTAILVNKYCLVNLNFPFPITIAWLGVVCTAFCSTIVVHTWLPVERRRGMNLNHFLTHVMPCGVAMAVAFFTGNMAFLKLSLSFIQMLKASTPVVTMLMLFAFRLEKPNAWLVGSVSVISMGVLMAGYAEGHASILGVVTMLISITAESLRLVLMQLLMDPKGGELHPLEGLMYISSAGMIALLSQAAFWEWGRVIRTRAYLHMLAHPMEFGTAAMAGFGVNLLAMLVIKLASSLTLKVLGTAKDAALVVIGVVLLNEQVSQLQLGGYLISLAGFVAYNWIKLRGSPAPGALSACPAAGTATAPPSYSHPSNGLQRAHPLHSLPHGSVAVVHVSAAQPGAHVVAQLQLAAGGRGEGEKQPLLAVLHSQPAAPPKSP